MYPKTVWRRDKKRRDKKRKKTLVCENHHDEYGKVRINSRNGAHTGTNFVSKLELQ